MADLATHDVYHYGLVQLISRVRPTLCMEPITIRLKVKFMNKLAIFALLCILSACSTTMQSKLWIPDWKETAPLIKPRAGAAVVAVNDTLFLIGGVMELNAGPDPALFELIDKAKAKKAAKNGPVVITDRGRPSHVLLTVEQYQEITGARRNILDLLAMPGAADIDFDPPRLADNMVLPTDLS